MGWMLCWCLLLIVASPLKSPNSQKAWAKFSYGAPLAKQRGLQQGRILAPCVQLEGDSDAAETTHCTEKNCCRSGKVTSFVCIGGRAQPQSLTLVPLIFPEVHFLNEYPAYDCLSPVSLLTISLLPFQAIWTFLEFRMEKILITFRENWVSWHSEEQTAVFMKLLLSTFLCQVQQTPYKWCKTFLWVTSWVVNNSNCIKMPGHVNLVSEELNDFSEAMLKKILHKNEFVTWSSFSLSYISFWTLKRVLAGE